MKCHWSMLEWKIFSWYWECKGAKLGADFIWITFHANFLHYNILLNPSWWYEILAVGYGDIACQTVLGKLVLACFLSVGLVSWPSAIAIGKEMKTKPVHIAKQAPTLRVGDVHQAAQHTKKEELLLGPKPLFALLFVCLHVVCFVC